MCEHSKSRQEGEMEWGLWHDHTLSKAFSLSLSLRVHAPPAIKRKEKGCLHLTYIRLFKDSTVQADIIQV